MLEQNATVTKQSNNDSDTLREEWKVIKKYLEEQGLSSEVAIQKIPDGVKVTLSDSLTFNSGSAELLGKARVVLGRIATVFDKDVRSIKVQGHTDNVPISRSSVYRSNWHLGAARAVSVVLFIHEKSSLEAGRFEASSFGKYKPVTTNSTPEGRRRNRRVEIYVQYRNESNASANMGTVAQSDLMPHVQSSQKEK